MSNKLFQLHLFFLYFFFILISNAQESKYIIKWYTDSEALPQNSIKDIYADTYGYIWFSTENGLSRFDGQNFNNYNREIISEITSNRMHFFYGSPASDSIYISNTHNQILLVNNHLVQQIPDSSLKKKRIHHNALKIFKYGNISSSDHYVANKKKIHLQRNSPHSFEIINDTIREYSENEVENYSYPFKFKESDQVFLHKKKLHVLTDGKLFRLSNGRIDSCKSDSIQNHNWSVYTNHISDQVFFYDSEHKETFLVKKIDDGSIHKKLILKDFNLKAQSIRSLYYDEENNIFYLGSVAKGLCVVKKKYFQSIFTGNNEHENVEYGIAKINDSILLTSSGAFLKEQKIIGHQYSLKKANKYFILMDSHKNLWMKRDRVLFEFEKDSNYKTFKQWKFDNLISSLYLDAQQQLWISSYNSRERFGNLYSINVLDSLKHPIKKTSFDFKINCIYRDESCFLFGTDRGLYRYDQKSNSDKAEKIKGLSSANVRGIQNLAGYTWITSYDKGFFMYDQQKLISFPLDENKYLSATHYIIDDKKGYFWLSTNKGLFQVSKKNLLSYTKDPLLPIYYYQYDKQDGFLSNEFNGGGFPSGNMALEKFLYFPSMEGIVTADISKNRPLLPDNPIFFDDVIIDGRHLHPQNQLILDQNFDRITFIISSPYHGKAINQTIEVKLEGPGLNKEKWGKLSEEMKISYTNLDPGHYTLSARKVSGFNADYIHANLKFQIPFPFYQKLWFKIGIVFLLFIIIQLGIKLRLKIIRHKNNILRKKVLEHTIQLNHTITELRKTKTRLSIQNESQKNLIASITHDIKNPLNFIAYVSKQSYDNFDLSPILKNNIKSVYTSSHQLTEFISNLLEYTKVYNNPERVQSRKFNLYQLINTKISLFQGIAEFQKTFIFNKVKHDMEIMLNKEFLSIILHNLLDNAVKNTYYGKITFDCYKMDNSLIISIADTGNGMSDKELNYYRDYQANIDNEPYKTRNKGLGIKIISELLIIMQGELKIESRSGYGTLIKLLFEIKQ
ncbi:ATP-binding protein [Galbibacter sp. PAP.153]|uniref:sensor histidine kinase n=1 Tax=Galbibacter sp. PAP.153 TaxID=3104623 RepID=UPI003009AD29